MPTDDLFALAPGGRVAGYRLDAVLGRGGMGVVFRAWHVALDRSAAVKVIQPELVSQPGFRERFQWESRAAAALEHPNVVPIFDAGEDGEVLYIAMRFVDGPDLAHELAVCGPLGPERAVRIVAQLADALDAAHRAGLVHRDVKPANVLLAGPRHADHVFLTDFGVSRRSDSATTRGQIVGTVDYMAPEQLRGEVVDARADIYALGAILFQLLTGRLVFPRDSDAAVMWAHINESPPSLRPLSPELPGALDDVLARALAKAPAERYGSAGELAAAARAAVQGREVEAIRVAADTIAPARADAAEMSAPPPKAHVELPAGVVTLLSAAVECATPLWQELGDGYADVFSDHRESLREVWRGHDGIEAGGEADEFLVAFADPGQALRAAAAAQRTLQAHARARGRELPVRIGVHTGSPRVRAQRYWGLDVHYAARLCTAAHGGQVLVSESTAALVDLPLEDLGEHAVNDFPSARRIFHLPVEGRGRESFPPIRTLRVGRTNLPDQVSSFVGREHELAELRTLLAGRRVVTLTGPGGVGKTRLALRLAAELLDGSGDGVWFVDLAPVVDRQLVGPTVAEAVGLPERPGRPALETLVEGLADRALLVVMDNCEHVVDAAATVVAGLVERCPGVSVLATSREPLRIPGEQVYRVPSLSTPDEAVEDVDELARAEAVCLFIERASQQRSGFALARENAATVARVCRRLDGIPLAIELAAVRVRSLSIADLDARLDQRFALLRGGSRTALPRQQTLLALIDWSYQLLSDAERRVLSHLSVFAAGGFDLEAAEAVCSIGGVDPSDLLDHLDMLVDKSLVQAEDSSSSIRYGLLETVREYAGLKLANRGEAEIKQARLAHRDHYLRLAEAVNQVLLGTDRRVGLDRLSIEQPNLRAALLESLNDPDPKPGLRLATALQAFWKARGHDAEGAAELTRQLRRPEAREPTLTRGRTLAAAADLYPETLGEFRTAIAYAEEALEIARLHADDPLAADALSSLTWSHLYVGEPDRAVAFGDEGVSLARKLGGGYVLSGMLGARGAALANLGREARPDLEEALEVARVTGNGSFVAGALSNLGYLELTAGDPSRAREHLEEALAVSRGLDEPRKAINSTINLGFACYLEGDGMTATARFAEVIRTADRNDLPSPLATALLGAALSSAVSPAAAQLHGAADALMHRVGLALDSFEAGLAEAHLKMLRTKLGRDAFQTAYEFGHRLKHEDAIALALPGSCAPRPLDL